MKHNSSERAQKCLKIFNWRRKIHFVDLSGAKPKVSKCRQNKTCADMADCKNLYAADSNNYRKHQKILAFQKQHKTKRITI